MALFSLTCLCKLFHFSLNRDGDDDGDGSAILNDIQYLLGKYDLVICVTVIYREETLVLSCGAIFHMIFRRHHLSHNVIIRTTTIVDIDHRSLGSHITGILKIILLHYFKNKNVI